MRSTSTKRWRFLIALFCAGTLVVAASCSNSGDDESSSDTTEGTSLRLSFPAANLRTEKA